MSNIFLKLNTIVMFKPVSLLNSKLSGLKLLQAWQDLTRYKVVCDVSNVMPLTSSQWRHMRWNFCPRTLPSSLASSQLTFTEETGCILAAMIHTQNLFPFLQPTVIFLLRKKYINWTVFMAKRQMRSVHLETLTRVFRGFWGPRLEFCFSISLV